MDKQEVMGGGWNKTDINGHQQTSMGKHSSFQTAYLQRMFSTLTPPAQSREGSKTLCREHSTWGSTSQIFGTFSQAAVKPGRGGIPVPFIGSPALSGLTAVPRESYKERNDPLLTQTDPCSIITGSREHEKHPTSITPHLSPWTPCTLLLMQSVYVSLMDGPVTSVNKHFVCPEFIGSKMFNPIYRIHSSDPCKMFAGTKIAPFSSLLGGQGFDSSFRHRR